MDRDNETRFQIEGGSMLRTVWWIIVIASLLWLLVWRLHAGFFAEYKTWYEVAIKGTLLPLFVTVIGSKLVRGVGLALAERFREK